ncbi:MAG TPA: PBP1A family penicillin-binding protein [Bacillota bacterium]|nr:PBP1A family penicillin-binding protein [Bacillota bacterium]
MFSKHTTIKKLSILLGGFFLLGISLMIGVYIVSFLLGPPSLSSEENTIYYSHAGDVIGEESGVEQRYWLDLDDMPEHVINATLSIEDANFYKHHGFDLKRIAGAAWADIKSLSLKEGASTLTQQYARNLYLTREKSWTRKLKEAFYTIRLEMFYSKTDILEGYLNTIYYGHGAYGIEAASKRYFDKSADDLTLAEAAMLAGIPKGPSYYSPFNDMEKAKQRQSKILKAMQDNGFINEKAYQSSHEEALTFADNEPIQATSLAPYFQDNVLKEASDILDVSREDIRSGGYHIYTTLDKDLQKQLQKDVETIMGTDGDLEIGAIAMEPDTGAVQALIGGRDYDTSPFNRATQAKRMVGSAFKPFLYYAALNNGYTASTQLLSAPTTFQLKNGQAYSPTNFNGYYANEPITLATALALSDNVYAVKTNMSLGTGKLVHAAKQFGIAGELPNVPSLALGSASVTVSNMTKAYSMLANGGHKVHAHTIEKIVDRNGKVVFQNESGTTEQILDPRTTFILTDLMTGMFDHTMDGYMSVTGAPISDQLTRNYAGKSGTTDSDSWMIGYSPQLATGIWTGYDDNRSIEKVKERTYAKKIWATFMEQAHKNTSLKGFQVPSGVKGIPIDPETGKRATPDCPKSRVMYFEKGTAPISFCGEHNPDKSGNENNDDDVPVNREKKGLFRRIIEKFF